MISHRKSKEVINIAWFGHTSLLLFKKKGHKTDIFPVLQKLTHICTLLELRNDYMLLSTHQSPITTFSQSIKASWIYPQYVNSQN